MLGEGRLKSPLFFWSVLKLAWCFLCGVELVATCFFQVDGSLQLHSVAAELGLPLEAGRGTEISFILRERPRPLGMARS